MSAFRRLISHCGAASSGGKTGNVSSQDVTEMVQASTSLYVPPDCGAQPSTTDMFEEFLFNVDFSVAQPRLGAMLGNVLVYICGWVVRKLMKKLTCNPCRLALVSRAPSKKYCDYFALLHLKDNGGLISPSDGIISIVLLVEHYLRSSQKATLLKIQTQVLHDIGAKDIFELGDHIAHTNVGISNHNFSLVRLCVEVFYDLRKHHMVKLHNSQLHKQNMRHRNNKSVLFKGQ